MLTYDQYVKAATLDDAFDALERIPGARLVAGATDLLPWAREGRAGDVHLSALIDVSGIEALRAISLDGARLSIGAATPIGAFESDARLLANAQVLGRCAAWFADNQIREQATVGGNIINASPAGDALPPLLAMNAHLLLARRESSAVRDASPKTTRGSAITERVISLADFIEGPGRTGLRSGEILVRIECDALPAHGATFEKVGHRRSLVISTVCLAILAKLDSVGAEIEDVRIAIGAVGPVPERLQGVESRLVGRRPTPELMRETAETVVEHVKSRTRQDYRREVLVNFVERGLIDALTRAGAALTRLPKEEFHV
jgi:xanthine dehydrogenase FAD-binding subunit